MCADLHSGLSAQMDAELALQAEESRSGRSRGQIPTSAEQLFLLQVTKLLTHRIFGFPKLAKSFSCSVHGYLPVPR